MKTVREGKIALSLLGFTAEQIHKIEEDLPSYFQNKELFLEQVKKNLGPNLVQKIKNADEEALLAKLKEDMNRLKFQVLVDQDEDYPDEFNYIENPPVVLYIRGDLRRVLEKERCGIVGARSHTAYGKAVAQDISRGLVDRDVAVVSGMALGIDAISQWACLDQGGRSIGVLGTGVDVIYPTRNKDLYYKLVEEGAIITEYPPGSQALPHHFPLRNRIISALSQCVIVIEAKEKSGSLITARYAGEQGKDIFAVPGNINSPYSQGTNLLIRDGALIYTKQEDLDFIFKKKTRQAVDLDIDEDERLYLQWIAQGMNTANLICLKTGHKIATVNMILTLLEMKGIIQSQGTDQFVLCAGVQID